VGRDIEIAVLILRDEVGYPGNMCSCRLALGQSLGGQYFATGGIVGQIVQNGNPLGKSAGVQGCERVLVMLSALGLRFVFPEFPTRPIFFAVGSALGECETA